MYALINPCNLICNMQLNVLNDLAEAMKALDGKKNSERACHTHLCQLKSPRGGRLDGFYFLSFRFLDPKKSRKIRHAKRASPVQDSCHGCCFC